MGIARADTAELRLGLYRGLMRRNRVVGGLRILVPVLGAGLFAALIAQIYLGGLARDFSVAGIGIDREHLVVEGPSFNGRTEDGTIYRITAQSARLAIADAERIVLDAPRLVFERPAAAPILATAAEAGFVTSAQRVEIGEMRFGDGEGLDGVLRNVSVDFATQVLAGAGPLRIALGGGVTIEAEGLRYDSRAGLWAFSRASVTLAGTPGETP